MEVERSRELAPVRARHDGLAVDMYLLRFQGFAVLRDREETFHC